MMNDHTLLGVAKLHTSPTTILYLIPHLPVLDP